MPVSGRLVAGLAAGSQEPEFTALGIPFAERGPRLEEGIAAVQALWTEAAATFRGCYYAFRDVRLDPKPVQQPHPPIWIGSWTGAPPAARRVARLASGWQGSGLFTTVDEARRAMTSLDAACRAIGRDPASLDRAFLNIATAVAPRREDAWDTLPPGMRAHPERGLAGTPDDLITRLRAIAEAGIAEAGLALPSWSEQELEMISREVMPAFRS
jgi:alkanesulfonate monooxygenase SsuD/methylene tetrahydromethanopterin reductase-like flavin-dependent oxidoreductase (luciferase family)